MVKPRTCSGMTSLISCTCQPGLTENAPYTVVLESLYLKRRPILSSLESEFHYSVITSDPRTADLLFLLRGEPWHRLRHDDLSPADLSTDTSPELRALIAALLSANPEARIDSAAVCAHPVVARTRAAMERLLEESLRAGERPFAASPLAGVPAGFLEEVLSHRREATTVATNADANDAMDVGA